MIIKKILISFIFNGYQKALIFEALDEKEIKKRSSLGESLIDDSKELKKIKNVFITNFDLYN